MLAGFGESVEVWRAAEPDRYGDRTWALHHEVADVLIDWTGSAVDRDRGVRETTDAILLFQSDPDIKGEDRIVIRGDKFAPDGAVQVWKMGAWRPGAALPVKRVAGGS